jgi:alkylation response protein AidB-like acyl-CoA dehydrogenase
VADFSLTADQRLFRSTTRSFLEKETPLTVVRDLAAAGGGFGREWWSRGAELGWTSMLVGEEFGGGSISGDGLLDTVIIAEEMGRLVSPGPLLVTSAVLVGLAEASTRHEHAKIINALIAGEAVATWAIYEPGRGWEPDQPTVTASPDGFGNYLLHGVKDRVEAGRQADCFLVTARTHAGFAQFLVPSDADGVDVASGATLDLVRALSRVSFDSVRVPATALVGTAGDTTLLQRQLDVAVVLQCAEIVGAVDRVLEFTVRWAFDRYSFGRPLASYQALKHRFADMKAWLEACAGSTSAAAHAVQTGTPDASELVSVAKWFVGQRATDIIQDCVQIHGGIGVTWEHDLHLYLRRVTTDRVTWGSPADHLQRLADLLHV